MRALPSLIIGRGLRTAGAPSLAQGVYGDHGNLELVVPDAADGLWVFWWNADAPGSPHEGVPPGAWSAGMRFATGVRWRDARIVQSTLGPDHLEVLALAEDGAVTSWYWSPGPGFVRRDGFVATGASAIGLSHRGGVLGAAAVIAGERVHLRAGTDDYPHRTWRRAAGAGPAIDQPAADEALVQAGVDPSTVVPGTARCATSTRAGGTLEVTWRGSDGEIHHLGITSPTSRHAGHPA